MRSILLSIILLAPLSCLAANYTFSGRVLDDNTSQPIAGASVVLKRATLIAPQTLASTTSTSDGSFTVGTDTSGTLFLEVSRSGYVTRSRIAQGDFSAPTTVENIEVRLSLAGTLSIRATDAANGSPLASLRVVTEGGATRQTDATGMANFTNLEPGEFRVCVIDSQSDYLNACVNGHALGFSIALAGPTATVVSSQTTMVELALSRGGAITGRIDDAYAGGPLVQSSVDLSLHDAGGALLHSRTTPTDANGGYRLAALPAGSYRLTAERRSAPNLARVLYRDLDCTAAGCPFAQGASIAVAPPATTPNIDFNLSPEAVATGRVTDAQSGAPLPGVRLRPYNNTGFLGWKPYENISVSTNAQGEFELPYLPTTFDLRLGTSDVPGYGNLGWPSVPCGHENCGNGTAFRLNLREVRGGFDFALTRGPAIRGRTLAIGTTRPVSADLTVYDAANNKRVWSGRSDANGDYATSTLPAGSYFVRAMLGAPDLTCSWFGDALCPNELRPSDFSPAVAVMHAGSNDTVDTDIGLRTLLILRSGFE